MHQLRIIAILFQLLVASLCTAAPPELSQAAQHIDSNPAYALELLLPLIEQAQENEDSKTEAIALRYAGMAYHRMGKPADAALFLQDGLSAARLNGHRAEEGDLLNTFGIYCFDIGMYEQSQRYFLQALEIRKQSGDTLAIARTTNNLGRIQDKIGNFDRAIEYYQESLALKNTTAEINGRILTLSNLGLAYKGKGDLEQAIRLYQEALLLSEQTTYPEGEGYAQQNLGEAYRLLGRLDLSLSHCSKALDAYRSVRYQPRLSQAAFETALTYQALKDYPNAEQLYNEALELATSQNQQELIRDIMKQLALLAEEESDLSSALSYFKRFVALQNSLSSVYNREKILILDAEHRSRYQQAEITLLRRDAELNQSKLQQQHFIVFALSALSLTAFGSIYYFRRQVKLRRAKEAELLIVTQALQKANNRLGHLATTDSLTKLSNRRQFDQSYPEDCARAKENGLDIALILADIDFFKQYNDQLGHLAGDRCLRQVASLLRRCLKETPYWAARYGGEEFAIVLYHAGVAEAANVAERFRQALENLSLPHPLSENGQITISLGIASALSCGSYQPDVLFKAADDALYLAKSGGRNQVQQ